MVTRRISPSLRKNYTWRLAENHALAEFIPETSYPSRRIIRRPIRLLARLEDGLNLYLDGM